jgi:trans-aconitate methyltransferase
MTEANSSRPGQHWDAGLYDGKHAFVWRHGAALIDLLAPKRGERILDLGCGTGHLTARIAESGGVVVGLDYSVEMLAQARLAYPGLVFVEGDARRFAFSEPFDAVFSNAALHWIREPDSVIRCVREALKPEGRFVVEFGGRGNVRIITDALAAAAAALGLQVEQPSWFLPSVGEYATLLEAARLEVASAVLFDRPTPLEGATGLRDWVRMFTRGMFESVPVERREEFLGLVEETARPALFRDGCWIADYRRLRVVAIRAKDCEHVS